MRSRTQLPDYYYRESISNTTVNVIKSDLREDNEQYKVIGELSDAELVVFDPIDTEQPLGIISGKVTVWLTGEDIDLLYKLRKIIEGPTDITGMLRATIAGDA